VLVLIAAGVWFGIAGWQRSAAPPAARPGDVSTQPQEKQTTPTATPAPVVPEPKPTASPLAPREATAPVQQVDPFKAFVNASKNQQAPGTAGQSPAPAQTTPVQDPFKAVAEESKKRSEAATISPFGR